MSYESRILTKPRDRYLKIYQWAVDYLGYSAAAVISQLDFYDRAEPKPGLPVATRARLIADLEGLVGQKKIDDSLKLLVRIGWIGEMIEVEHRPKNITSTKKFYLKADAVNDWRSGISSDLPEPSTDTTESQNCNPRNCNSAGSFAKPLYTVNESKAEVVAATAASAFKVSAGPHPKTAAALIELAVENHQVNKKSDAAKSQKTIKQALAAAKALQDSEAAAVVQQVSDAGGWLTDAATALAKAAAAETRQTADSSVENIKAGMNKGQADAAERVQFAIQPMLWKEYAASAIGKLIIKRGKMVGADMQTALQIHAIRLNFACFCEKRSDGNGQQTKVA
jgi:hypothetical protein